MERFVFIRLLPASSASGYTSWSAARKREGTHNGERFGLTRLVHPDVPVRQLQKQGGKLMVRGSVVLDCFRLLVHLGVPVRQLEEREENTQW